jgi:hypothetical protein
MEIEQTARAPGPRLRPKIRGQSISSWPPIAIDDGSGSWIREIRRDEGTCSRRARDAPYERALLETSCSLCLDGIAVGSSGRAWLYFVTFTAWATVQSNVSVYFAPLLPVIV